MTHRATPTATTTGTGGGAPPASVATMVLDTSVLLADPAALLAFDGAHVVITATVLRELGGKKADRDLGWAARETLRTLEEHLAGLDGDRPQHADLPHGGTLRFEPNGVHTAELEALGFDARRSDIRIIGACLGLRDQGHHPVLVTLDTEMRLTAQLVGIPSRRWESVLPIEHAGPGWRQLWAQTSADVANAHRLGGLDPDLLPGAGDVDVNEALLLRDPAAPKTSVLLRKHADGSLRQVPGDRCLSLGPAREYRFKPRNLGQRLALDLLMDPAVKVVCLIGQAGTGKTIEALAAGLAQLDGEDGYTQVGIYRPVVPVGSNTDLGFLPGTLEEKLAPWFTPVVDNFTALTGKNGRRGSPQLAEQWIARLRAESRLDYGSIAHIRGRSIAGAYLIVDEAQNLEPSVAKALLTRAGEGTKLVFTGDVTQRDTVWTSERNNALTALVQALHGEHLFGHIVLHEGERSDLADLAARRL